MLERVQKYIPLKKRNENSGVSPLKVAGKLITNDKERAEILNSQFQSSFSAREDFSEEEFRLRFQMLSRNPEQPTLEDIIITTAGVEKLLRDLDPSKAKQQILCTKQHGFRKGRSCETQFLGLDDEISCTLEDDHQEDLLVLDFSKAFDKVSHSLLVHKLKYYGIDACHDTIKTTHDQVRLQEDLDKLAEWEGRWKMSFHPPKCSIDHMTRRKKTLERAYELHVWNPHSNKDISTLEKVQRRAARWVCSRYRQTSSVESTLEDLQWETLQQRRRKARLTTFYKLHHGMITVDSRNLPTVSQHKRQTRRSHPLTYDIRLCNTKADVPLPACGSRVCPILRLL
ncbi:hypothetical protein Bbelb_049420 [Branchiostoma belcheri]|nr:hypothetical protein Bbelb_049420 [Branchiostoma belcheri]